MPSRRSPDDLIMICTGGTTGRPKGVLWRQGDIYVSSMVGADHECVARDPRQGARTGAAVVRGVTADARRRHVDGVRGAARRPDRGALRRQQKFDPRSVWQPPNARRSGMMTMVGDAYAAPLVAELRRGVLRPVLAVRRSAPAGRPPTRNTNGHCWNACRTSPSSTATARRRPATWDSGTASGGNRERHLRAAQVGALVVSDDYSRFLQPGEQEVGWVARAGRIPLGYFDDAEATRKTFPEVEGQRVVISGDRARWRPTARCGCSAGTRWWSTPAARRFSSRRSRRCCAPIRASPTRWWSAGRANGGAKEVVALVALHDGADLADERRPVTRICTTELARFKAPKEFIVVDQVQRLGNGKADYRWAKRASYTAGDPQDAMTQQSDRLPGQRALRRDRIAAQLDAEGPRRLLQGPGVDVRARRPVRAARRDGRARRAKRPS